MVRIAKLEPPEILHTLPLIPLPAKRDRIKPEGSSSLEHDYFGYLKDKRVVIVGPAGYLLGQGRGEEFDNYDVIIRINLSCPVKEELRQDIGSRTDVLYHLIIRDRHIKQRPDLFKPHTKKEVETWKGDGVKWVVIKSQRKKSYAQQFEKVAGDIIPIAYISNYRLNKMHQATNTAPNTGKIAIWHTLQSKAKSLHVAGMDFHQTGYYPGYGGFTEEQAQKGARDGKGLKICWGQVEDTGRENLHSVPGQLEFLSLLMKRDRRFTADKNLTDMLGGGGR